MQQPGTPLHHLSPPDGITLRSQNDANQARWKPANASSATGIVLPLLTDRAKASNLPVMDLGVCQPEMAAAIAEAIWAGVPAAGIERTTVPEQEA